MSRAKFSNDVQSPPAQRSWTDWLDDTNNDRTFLGFQKTPARLRHDAELLQQKGMQHLPVTKATDPATAKLTPERVAPTPAQTPIPSSVTAWGGGGAGPGGSPGPASGDYSGALYGLGGAGAGALLGAALGGKKRRGTGAMVGGALGGGAGLLAHALMNQKTSAEEKQANPVMDFLNKHVSADAQRGGMYGGLGGAALGGLAGLVAPGETDEYDADGNVIGRKRRSRFGAALRGALGGGVLGAGAGGLAGQFAPGPTNKVIDALQGYGAQAKGYGSQLARRLGYRGKSTTAPSATTSAPGTGPSLTTTGTLLPGVDTGAMKAPVSATYQEPSAEILARRAEEARRATAAKTHMNEASERGLALEKLLTTPKPAVGFDALPQAQQEALLQEAAQQARDKYLARLSPPTTNLDAAGLDMSGLDTNSVGSATMGR